MPGADCEHIGDGECRDNIGRALLQGSVTHNSQGPGSNELAPHQPVRYNNGEMAQQFQGHLQRPAEATSRTSHRNTKQPAHPANAAGFAMSEQAREYQAGDDFPWEHHDEDDTAEVDSDGGTDDSSEDDDSWWPWDESPQNEDDDATDEVGGEDTDEVGSEDTDEVGGEDTDEVGGEGGGKVKKSRRRRKKPKSKSSKKRRKKGKEKGKGKGKDKDEDDEADSSKPDLSTVIRPNLGKQAEIIEVGLLVKKFMGVKFADHQFEVDVLVTSRWADDRAKELLQSGAKLLTISGKDAREVVWVPDIVITNRVHEQMDVLSSVVQISSNGSVMKIDRVHVTLQCLLSTNAFPFDEQTLPIKIASSTLMVDQLMLKVDPDMCGVEDNAFEDNTFQFKSSTVQSYEEFDGPLQKSRARLDVLVKRKTASCISTVLLPLLLVASISWSGFFMPCNNPAFIMPRVATSFVSYLMQVTLDTKIDAIQPDRSTDSWLDILHECLECTVYFAVVTNIIVQYTAFYDKLPELGKKFDEELQIFLPIITVVLTVVCFCFSGVDEQVYELKLLTRGIMVFTLIPYIISMLWRLRTHRKDQDAPKEITELPAFKPAPAPASYATPMPAAGGYQPVGTPMPPGASPMPAPGPPYAGVTPAPGPYAR